MEEDSITLSTDMRSDISFMNRQKELRNVYREFRAALDQIHSSIIDNETNKESPNEEETNQEIKSEEESFENSTNCLSEEEVSNDNVNQPDENENKIDPDLEMILQEIELLQSEAEEIKELLSKPKFAHNPRVTLIMKQLSYIQRVNENMKLRAESLIE